MINFVASDVYNFYLDVFVQKSKRQVTRRGSKQKRYQTLKNTIILHHIYIIYSYIYAIAYIRTFSQSPVDLLAH